MSEVVCACSWIGQLLKQAECPACGRCYHDRITQVRVAALRALRANPRAGRNRVMLARLVELGMVVAIGPRPTGSDRPRRVAPLRPYGLTPAGLTVLEAIDRRTIEEQTRHDVAASVARHAAIEGL